MTAFHRPIFFGLFAVLLSFYAGVFYLALTPDVSQTYRLYYIDKKLKYWNHGAELRYQAGSLVDFAHRVPYLSRQGWAQEESLGTWSIGKTSELYFDLERTQIPRQLEIKGYPHRAPSKGISTQVMKVFANNSLLGETVLDSTESIVIKCNIPDSIRIEKDNLFVLRFQFPDTVSSTSTASADSPEDRRFFFEHIIIH